MSPGRVARYGLRLSMMSFRYVRSKKKNPPPGVPVAGVVPEGIVPDGKALSEVGYAALKDWHELIAGDMLGHVAV